MKKAIIVVVFLATLSSVHAQDFPSSGVLIGCVNDAWTGEGVNGVAVTVFNSNTSASSSTYSKSYCEGYYAITMSGVPEGCAPYTVNFSKSGYVAQTESVSLCPSSPTHLLNTILSPEMGYINVTSTPAGAEISLDGSLQGLITPDTLTVHTGSYAVSVSKTGYITPSSQTVEVTENSTTSVNFTLEPEVITRDISSGRTSSSESPTADLTIFREEILTEDHLLDFMHSSGDAHDVKHAFDREMGPLAPLYAARGENIMTLEMADALSAAYPESETGMLRVEGEDIYQLAADYVLEHYSSPKTLIIVRGDLAADSLVATPLSALLNAPILLVEPGRIPEPDFRVLDQGYERIYIIGGAAAVSRTVAQELGNYSDTIIRLWGETRYETSVEVARVVGELGENNQAILTNGEKPVLYSASLSERYRAPILYLDAPQAMQSTRENPHQEAVSRYISEQALDIGMIYY